jgi:hypothetical protein
MHQPVAQVPLATALALQHGLQQLQTGAELSGEEGRGVDIFKRFGSGRTGLGKLTSDLEVRLLGNLLQITLIDKRSDSHDYRRIIAN